jgi:hypothetical protein
MVLAMSRPWKHPKTGIYWLRKGVPDDLRAAVCKREEKFSLKTRDPVEAKRLHAQALIEIEQRWSNLRAPISKLDNSELHRISIMMYERCLELGELPGVNWDTAIGEHLWESGFGYKPEDPFSFSCESVQQTILETWCKARADELISVNGLKTG